MTIVQIICLVDIKIQTFHFYILLTFKCFTLSCANSLAVLASAKSFVNFNASSPKLKKKYNSALSKSVLVILLILDLAILFPQFKQPVQLIKELLQQFRDDIHVQNYFL